MSRDNRYSIQCICFARRSSLELHCAHVHSSMGKDHHVDLPSQWSQLNIVKDVLVVCRAFE